MLSNQLSTTKLNQIMSAKVMKALAEKYDFDAKEAKEFLIEEGILKAPKKRVTTPKADKPKKDKSDKPKKAKSDKPKKAKSGYLLHNDAEREGIKIKLEKDAEESGETLKSSEIMVALGAHWKALSDDDKKAWNDKAKALKMTASDSEDNVTEDEVAEDEVEVTEHEVEVTEDDVEVTEDDVEVTEDDVEVKKEKVKKEKVKKEKVKKEKVKKEKVEKEENSENDE